MSFIFPKYYCKWCGQRIPKHREPLPPLSSWCGPEGRGRYTQYCCDRCEYESAIVEEKVMNDEF